MKHLNLFLAVVGLTLCLTAGAQSQDAMRLNEYLVVNTDDFQDDFGQQNAWIELFNSSSQAETAKSNVLIGAWRMLALSGEMLPKMNIDCSGIYKAPPVDPEDKREVFEAGWFN